MIFETGAIYVILVSIITAIAIRWDLSKNNPQN